jgi:hypothetical protein
MTAKVTSVQARCTHAARARAGARPSARAAAIVARATSSQQGSSRK